MDIDKSNVKHFISFRSSIDVKWMTTNWMRCFFFILSLPNVRFIGQWKRICVQAQRSTKEGRILEPKGYVNISASTILLSLFFIAFIKCYVFFPSAKLMPNCPKPERPHRDGAKKSSVESQLEDAALKMANKAVSVLNELLSQSLYLPTWSHMIQFALLA